MNALTYNITDGLVKASIQAIRVCYFL